MFNAPGGSYDNSLASTDDLDLTDNVTVTSWDFAGGGQFSGFDSNAQVGMPSDNVTKIDGDDAAQPAVGSVPDPSFNLVSFSIVIPAGTIVDLSSVDWVSRQATGNTSNARWLAFNTSLDTTLLHSAVGSHRNDVDTISIDLSGAAYQGLTDTTVSFNWYAGGTGSGDQDFDTPVVHGTVSDAATNPPTVVNSGASAIQATTATLSGEVTDTGGAAPSVILHWGDNDGGTNPTAWDNSVPLGTQGGIFSTGPDDVSGLTPATTYYFRCFASNSAGDDWANSTTSFITAPPPNPPSVVNTPASNVTYTTAYLNGTVTSTGGETPNVTIYYGDNDGDTAPGSWDAWVDIGEQAGSFSQFLLGRTHNTTYYYRAYAENSGGSAWAPTTADFTTLAYSLPVVTTDPASNITGTAAQVGGEVTDTGDDAPTVTIYYGDNDGLTTIGSWDDSVILGPQSADFSSVLIGLSPLTTYYYRVHAQNAAGTVWSGSTESFTTLEVSELIINEFMAANGGGDPDDPDSWYPIANQVPGTTDDWIEILNTGTSPLDLGGWHLTDDAGDLTQWTIPSGTNLAGGDFLIVYASGNNAPDANGNLHTNFRLSADGEHVALVRPDGSIASSFGLGGADYPGQSDDVSYGMHPHTGAAVYFSAPTPGAANDANGLARVEGTKFSPDRGYYQTAIDVTISTVTPGATIYYTTDGAPPVDGNGNPTATATAYSAAIPLTQTTAVRAAAVQTGLAPAQIDTQTYVLLDIDGANPDGTDPAGLNTPFLQQTQPAGWGNLSSGDFNMDTDVSQSTSPATDHATSTAQTMLLGMRDIPTISIAMDRDDFSGGNGIYSNSTSTGFAWERECSAEFIPATGDTRSDWGENCGIRAQGGASRNPSSSPKHSLSFRFRAEYGPGKLREVMFPESEVEEFNVIALRAGYNNSWIHRDDGQRSRGSMIRDQWIRESMLDMGSPAAGHGFMAHIFINGLYWGVHNLCERQDTSHYAAYNGGDEDLLDARNADETIDGSDAAYNAMIALVNATGTTDYWSKVQGVLDIDQFINYHIINRYGANSDLHAGNNWRAAGGGPFPTGQPELMAPWQIYSWDAERTLESQTATNNPDPMAIRTTLEGNAEYRIRLADRLQKHFFHGGALTPEATKARWMKYADDLDRAIIAESARWGDHRREPPYTRNGEWLTEQERLYDDYFPVRSSNVFNAYDSLFPDTDAPIFQVNASPQHGGEIPSGGTLSVAATSGTIYYTLDGSDPRLEGGAINFPSAIALGSGDTLPLSASGLVRMRALNGGEWSALDEATFYLEALAGPGDLAVTEIHYHPYRADSFERAAGAALTIPRDFDNPDDFEFIELQNISGQAVNLDGVAFTAGIAHTFGVHSLPPGGHVVLVKDPEAFGVRHAAVTPSGTYLGKLDNAGEELVLASAAGNTMLTFTYDDEGQWPGRPDGNGSSLERVGTSGDYSDSANWRPSSEFNGSPGIAGSGPDNRIVINEVLTHTDSPDLDTIELYNTTGGTIDISAWILSDDNGIYPSFSIPSTSILSGACVTFDEDDFNVAPPNLVSFYSGTPAAAPTTVSVPSHGLATGDTITIDGYGGISLYNDSFEVTVTNANTFTIDTPFLDNHGTKGNWGPGRSFALNAARGDDLWLLETNSSGRPIRFVDRVDFAAAFNGEALGRWPNAAGTGTLVSMSPNTLGSVNLGAQVGPVIISEFMYQPDAAAGDMLEFIEICNAGVVTENLAEWRLRGGADFDFTASHSLAPGGLLVVVPFDPLTQPTETAAFRAAYGIDATVPLVGPFTDGPLGDDSGTVRLQRAGWSLLDEPTFYAQITEDEVIYQSVSPWPTGAAGNGDSLHRAGPGLFGNFASSWSAELPTPGVKPLDYTDWAANYPGSDLSDPDADLDGDGLTNNEERIWGLDPTSSSSVVPVTPGPVPGTFTYTRRDPMLTDITYTVWTSTDLQTWTEDTGAIQTPGTLVDEVETVIVTLTAPPADGRLFARMDATE